MMRRAYKFRLRPTAKQHAALQACLDVHRRLYNDALAERRDAWEQVKALPAFATMEQAKSPVTFTSQSADLPVRRATDERLARFGSGSEQATLRRLDRAFQAFFRRVRNGEVPGYPRFKAADRFDSVIWPSPGDACRWIPETSRVYLQGVGQVKVSAHRSVEGKLKTISVKREGRRWFLVLSCDEVPDRPLEPTGEVVGIDVGIARFLATSDGELVENPRHGRVAAERLEAAQRRLQHKRRGSKNRAKAREVVARRHRKIADQRRDFHHQLARRLVAESDVLCIEDLVVKNMVRRPAPAPAPERPGEFLPNGAAAKAGLNRSISDTGWAQFTSILRAKAEEAGRIVVGVNPRHTSQTCNACGHVDARNRVSQAEFRCLACGHTANADVNAAKNILGAGLALLAGQVSQKEAVGF